MSVFLMVALAASVGCRSDPPAVSAPTAPEPALVEDASALAQPVGLPPDRAPTMEAMLVTDRLRTASARHVTLSAGGRWIVVLGRSGSIQVLTGARGRIVLERTFLPDQPCSGLAVTPNGRRLLVRGTDGVRLLNLWTGDVLQTVVPGVGWTCGLSVDGEHILVAKEGVLRVFDAGGSEPTSELELPFEGAVRRIQASAGARTVVVSSDEQAWVWGGNHRSRWRALSGWNPAGPLVVSSSGEWIAGRLGELKVRLWDGKFGTAKKEFRAAHVHGFLAQDKNVLLRNAQGELTVMEIETGEPIVSQSTFPGVLAVGMNPAGTAAAVVGGSTTEHWVGVWNLQSGPRFQRNQQRVRPRSLRWTFDGKALQIRSASFEWTVSRASGGSLRDPIPLRVESAVGAGFVDGLRWQGRIRAKFQDHDLVGVEDATDRFVWSQRTSTPIRTVASTRTGEHVLVLNSRGEVARYQAADGVRLDSWAEVVPATTRAMVTDPQRDEVILIEKPGHLVGRDVSDGAILWTASAPRWPRSQLTASRDGRWFVVGAGTRIALFQRSDSLVHKATHRLSTRVRRFALSPDGQRLAVSDGTDVTTWAFPDASMQARLQFLPEGRFLVRNHTASHFSDNMLPYIRFRQGLELLERGTPAVEAATQRWRSSELPL